MAISGGLGQAPFGFLPSGGGGGGSGGGGTSKAPLTFIIGTTLGAPAAASSTWTNAALANTYVSIDFDNSLMAPSDPGNGNPYFTKASKATTTINFFNLGAGGFVNGDILIVNFL